MLSEAMKEQRRLEGEVDKLAAKLIRERGIPLYDAIVVAQKMVRERGRQDG